MNSVSAILGTLPCWQLIRLILPGVIWCYSLYQGTPGLWSSKSIRLPCQKINCATIRKVIYQARLDYRTPNLSLNKSLVAEHATMRAIEATIFLVFSSKPYLRKGNRYLYPSFLFFLASHNPDQKRLMGTSTSDIGITHWMCVGI